MGPEPVACRCKGGPSRLPHLPNDGCHTTGREPHAFFLIHKPRCPLYGGPHDG